MSICRGCGAQIEWIHMRTGKSMPVDPEPVFVIVGDGKERFVTDEGTTILGRCARPEEEPQTFPADFPVGFVPHWKTCPNAADFRKR